MFSATTGGDTRAGGPVSVLTARHLPETWTWPHKWDPRPEREAAFIFVFFLSLPYTELWATTKCGPFFFHRDVQFTFVNQKKKKCPRSPT